MRIVSKFQDYYDSIQAYGTDKELIYLRQPKDYDYDLVFRLNRKNKYTPSALEKAASVRQYLPSSKKFKDKRDEWILSYNLVGFCGKWHVCAKAVKKENDSLLVTETKFFYSADKVRSWINKVNITQLNDYFYKGKYSGGYVYDKQEAGDKTIDSVFSTGKKLTDELFLELKTPVITFNKVRDSSKSYYNDKTVARANGCLKEFGFAKCKDPFTCYQEISMYLGGVLGVGEPCTINISDEDMRDKKGFNDWSFKTMPGTKKPRRKKK